MRSEQARLQPGSKRHSKFAARLQMRRLDFTNNLVNELQTGAGKLTNADLNEEAAKLLSLQVRSRLGLIGLNIANENQKAVLDLF